MLNIFVQLLIAATGFRGVKIAGAYDMTVGCVEVERTCDIVELANWKVLHDDLYLMGHLNKINKYGLEIGVRKDRVT